MSNTYYGDYLGIDPLLELQRPRSEELGRPAHDEMLFIITHQVYELWFKQVLHELNSVLTIFEEAYVKDHLLSAAVARLERVIEIEHLLIHQIQIMETMRPLDFLEFRDLLVPASGFQSVQFRLIENCLGLKKENRLKYHQKEYQESLCPMHQQVVETAEEKRSLFEAIEAWLERTPFLQFGDFDFWQSYRESVEQMFAQDRQRIQDNSLLSEKDVTFRLRQLNNTEQEFTTLFNPESYQELRDKGEKRLSYRATQAALLILLYRERPILHLPYRLLTSITTIDELLTNWRYRHAQMVQRMLGSKQGTGGSLGYDYLIKTLESHTIFGDFIQLTTFFIPRSELPLLPLDVERQLGFFAEKDMHHA